ncbi:hypothetical protein GH714_030999 [Hevea brasiliensis]|uniref:Uncharacterized protein n=1 Tax=Hevea brasiliensis TaxID=3981 RepID=A0A6A6LQR8_HEVBR|nr:hypothetical protein GH714_030999 [Hevea brasiliensis]
MSFVCNQVTIDSEAKLAFFIYLWHQKTKCASSRSASQSHSDQQELNATITEPHASDIINQPTKDGQIKESDAYSQQPQEPSSELEEMPNEPLSSIEIGNSESSLQENYLRKLFSRDAADGDYFTEQQAIEL